MPLEVLVQPFLTTFSAPEQGLDVVITIWNRGSAFAILEEMSCSWDTAYRIDNPDIRFQGWGCGKNVFKRRVLAPNEKVAHPKVSLSFSQPQPREIAFRIGLVQRVQKISQADLEKAYHTTRFLPRIETAHALKSLPLQTAWSAPVRVRARTVWNHLQKEKGRRILLRPFCPFISYCFD